MEQVQKIDQYKHHAGATTYNPDVYDYWQLLKPRVMSLVVFTAIVGMMLAPNHNTHPLMQYIAILCIACGSGASGAINMWFDRDIDALMVRTQSRPIPSGRVSPDSALAFGIILSALSVGVMIFATNYLAGLLLAFTIVFYSVFYTMYLKRRTVQNIVIGGAAGAFPPMIGWASVSGTVSMESLVLFLIIFLWTPPHFWALALYKNEDYKKANVPMLPVIKGSIYTRKHIFYYSLLLVLVSFLPYMHGWLHGVYLYGVIILNIIFLFMAYLVLRYDNVSYQKKLFFYSIAYLFLLFALMIADRQWIAV